MNVLFLSYANNSQSPLEELQEEDHQVYQLLVPRALQQHYLIHRDACTTKEKIAEFLILYREHIFLFAYSGHAGTDRLIVEGAEIYSQGLAKLLGRCPNLKMVLLNGCSTKAQVRQLLREGVPVVVATSAPIQDRLARVFATHFFMALARGDNFAQAFEAGIGGAKQTKPDLMVERSLGMPNETESAQEEISWGLYYQEKQSLRYRLPVKTSRPVLSELKPNELLINALVNALKTYSDEVNQLRLKEKNGQTVSISRKRMAVLNSLPAPVAEHLRKLMVPVKDENEGYDKLTIIRLQQLIRVYEITMELMAFTMLAQLWETKLLQPELLLPTEHVQVVLDFVQRPLSGREAYDYIHLIQETRQILDLEANRNLVNYFVSELLILKELPYQDEKFMSATFFLQTLRQRLVQSSLTSDEIPTLCIKTEEALADIFEKLGFMAKYNLAAINDIDVQKYRHSPKPSFRHNVVRLIDLLGGLEQTELIMERFTDNRSVLLLKEDEGLSELNLSPFIIDKNAFEKDADVSNIYFFSHYDPTSATYFFYYINNPEDQLIEVSDHQFPIVKAQLDAFIDLISTPPAPSSLESS